MGREGLRFSCQWDQVGRIRKWLFFVCCCSCLASRGGVGGQKGEGREVNSL